MSRIRSIHPGFFTDERIVSTSVEARLLFIGLGVEADDKGIFEWKPITLKMRLFPADSIDVAAMLDELEAAEVLQSYEIGGRKFGAIRNFRKHQRPKTPNDIHPIAHDVGIYVGLAPTISETVSDKLSKFPPKGEMGNGLTSPISEMDGVKPGQFPQKGEMSIDKPPPFPQKGEKHPQMEDGGWRMEDGDNSDTNVSSSSISPEPKKTAPANVASVIDLPCTSGDVHPITEDDVSEWSEAFPGVDVRQQLLAMRAWLKANPSRAKTKRGMKRFVVSWLDREQNRGVRSQSQPRGSPTVRNKPETDLQRISRELRERQNEPTRENPCIDGEIVQGFPGERSG